MLDPESALIKNVVLDNVQDTTYPVEIEDI